MTVSAEQLDRLVTDLEVWVAVLDVTTASLVRDFETAHKGLTDGTLGKPNKKITDEGAALLFQIRANTHMIALALRQTARHLRQLRGSSAWTKPVDNAVEAFLNHYKSQSIQDLRDLLEHSAEYMAGKGTKPELVVDDPLSSFPSLMISNQEISSVLLFGRNYQVSPAIKAAREAAEAVRVAHPRQVSRGEGETGIKAEIVLPS